MLKDRINVTADEFIPVILGVNIHAYAAAASFYEDYGVKCIYVAAGELSFTQYSHLYLEYKVNPNIYDSSVFVTELLSLAERYKGKKLLLVATTDEYVKLLVQHAEELKDYFIFNFPEQRLFNQLYYKKNFYELCEQFNLDIPKTYTIDCSVLKSFDDDIQFPVIIKVDDGVAYFNINFLGKQKIYHLNSYGEINQTITMLYEAGYRKSIILQEYITGPDHMLWDMVYYGDSNGKGQVITLAQVLQQEPQLTAVDNYTALITRHQHELMTSVVNMMESLNYKGFANFDLKYDHRDGKFKFFEVNLRAGRSSSYIKESGYSIASCYVEDLIYHRQHSLTYLDKKAVFSVIPPALLLQQLENSALKEEVRETIQQHGFFNPLKYKKDRSIKRRFYLLLRDINYRNKYKNREWTQQ